jgi:hypothetical protein
MKERLVIVALMISNVFTVGKNNLSVGYFHIEKIYFRTGLAERSDAGKEEADREYFFHRFHFPRGLREV